MDDAELEELLEGVPVEPPTLTGATGIRPPPRVPDPLMQRRGKSSLRLGKDGERRSHKRYGWKRVGMYGGIDDLVGRMFIVQQKTTRSAPPIGWKGVFARLDERAGGRIPLILHSYVHSGLDTEDFIVIRGRDWLALHGRDEPE